MEFNEKLQELRKNKGLTQEELAEELYVSRAAVSKWESGRGYPSIDSLKDISKYFSVSVDDLLSGEKLLSIAEKEHKTNTRNMCEVLFGVVDLFSVFLIILPLYPNTVDSFIYSVNLLNFVQISPLNKYIYWVIFIVLILLGLLKLILTKINGEKINKATTVISVATNIFAVSFLALTRVVYAAVVVFLLLIIKFFVLLKHIKNK